MDDFDNTNITYSFLDTAICPRIRHTFRDTTTITFPKQNRPIVDAEGQPSCKCCLIDDEGRLGHPPDSDLYRAALYLYRRGNENGCLQEQRLCQAATDYIRHLYDLTEDL